MSVVIIRHAEVDFCQSRRCTSEMFDSECRKYDLSPIRNVTYGIPQTAYQKIYVSELSRSKDTAKILFPDEEFFESHLINEVPLKSSFDTKMNMPLWFWNLTGRLQWFINCRRQVEGRRQTRERAKEFVELIKNDDMDVAVVTHGFYMHTLLQEMKKVGFMMTGSSVKFKNGEYVTAKLTKNETRSAVLSADSGDDKTLRTEQNEFQERFAEEMAKISGEQDHD